MTLPTPHGDKLQALLRNDKLPNGDRKLIEKAIARYQAWLNKLAGVSGDDHCVNAAVAPLNEYRTFLALEVVFDGGDDFLYRRKGRLKLDNTVSEEFPPRLVARVFPQLADRILGVWPVIWRRCDPYCAQTPNRLMWSATRPLICKS